MVVEHLKRAWKAYRKNFWPLVGAYLLIVAIAGLLVVGGVVLAMGPFMAAAETGEQPTVAEVEANVPYMIVGALSFLLGMVVSVILGGGFIAMAGESLSRKTKLKTLFDTVRKRWMSLIGTEILRTIIIMFLFVPAILFFIPFLYDLAISSLTVSSWLFLAVAVLLAIIAVFASLLFRFNVYAVVLDKTSAVDGIRRSFAIVRRNYLSALALVVLLGFISLVAVLVPILGTVVVLLFVQPFIILSLTSFYLSKRGRK